MIDFDDSCGFQSTSQRTGIDGGNALPFQRLSQGMGLIPPCLVKGHIASALEPMDLIPVGFSMTNE